MNVVIIGVTSIGQVLAKYMVEEGHDVHVVDQSAEAIQQLLSNIDVRALQGDARDPAVLQEAQIGSSDLVLAVTNSDTRNIVTALGLHSLAPRARAAIWVRDEQFTDNTHIWNGQQFDQAMLLTPERNALNLVMDLLEIPLAFEAVSFLDGKIHIAGFRLLENSPLIGKRLKEIDHSGDDRTLVVAVDRVDETIIPTGDFVFKAFDRLYIPLLAGRELSSAFSFMGLQESLAQMRKTRHLIGGGGKMAYLLAHKLEQAGFHPTIVERDRDRGLFLAQNLAKTRVLQGDVTDLSLMKELIDPATTYIALTGNQEINFMSSVLARQLGSGRAITMFDNEGYISLSALMGIDAAVHPNLTAIGQVLGLLRPCDVLEAQLMLGGKLEAALIKLDRGAPMAGKALREAGIPPGVIIAAFLRNGQLYLPDGNMVLQEEDQILMVANRQQKVRQKIRQLVMPAR